MKKISIHVCRNSSKRMLNLIKLHSDSNFLCLNKVQRILLSNDFSGDRKCTREKLLDECSVENLTFKYKVIIKSKYY